MVEAIGRLDNFKRTTFAGRPAVLVRNDMYTLTMLSQILSLSVSNLDDKAQLLFINAGGQRVALVVDEIRGKSDVVMKNLGPHLRNVRGVAGGTFIGYCRQDLISVFRRPLVIPKDVKRNYAIYKISVDAT